MKKIVFDAHPILKWLQEESGYQKIKALIVACQKKSSVGYMNQINVGEVYYKVIRTVGIDEAKSFLENFFRLPIIIVPPDGDLVWHAAEIKADYPISFADCFVVATALKYEATIITGDPEFKKIKSIAPVEWI